MNHSWGSSVSRSAHINAHTEPLDGGQPLAGAEYLPEHDRVAELGFGGCGGPNAQGAGGDTHGFPDELPLEPFSFLLN